MKENNNYYCSIIETDIISPCQLINCKFHFINKDNLNCIRIYSKNEPLEIEDISFITDLPLWIVRNLKKEGIQNIKRFYLKENLKSYTKSEDFLKNEDEDILKLESYYNINIRYIITEAIQIANTIASLSKLLNVSPQTIKNLVKVYLGNIDEIIPSAEIFRKIKHLPLVKKARHEPTNIKTLFKNLNIKKQNSKLNFNSLHKQVDTLIST